MFLPFLQHKISAIEICFFDDAYSFDSSEYIGLYLISFNYFFCLFLSICTFYVFTIFTMIPLDCTCPS